MLHLVVPPEQRDRRRYIKLSAAEALAIYEAQAGLRAVCNDVQLKHSEVDRRLAWACGGVATSKYSGVALPVQLRTSLRLGVETLSRRRPRISNRFSQRRSSQSPVLQPGSSCTRQQVYGIHPSLGIGLLYPLEG